MPSVSSNAQQRTLNKKLSQVFRMRGLSVRPKAGDVLLFYNTQPNSWNADEWPWHGSCEVTQGEKWAANLWFHETIQRHDFFEY